MIRELCVFGEQLRQEQGKGKLLHDALKDEYISFDLLIRKDGSFYGFQPVDKVSTQAETILSKKGKARLLLDKPEEVLCFDTKEKSDDKSKKATESKHRLFLDKFGLYREVDIINPVFLFYEQNRAEGYEKAFSAFPPMLEGVKQIGNIAFRLVGEDKRIHEKEEVYAGIITKFEAKQREIIAKSGEKKCSVCGESKYPVIDQPHGMIKRVPDGQTAGCALVSYNEKVFESYNLGGNLNSSICTACARKYVEGLNYLLNKGTEFKADGKKKKYFKYEHRKNLGADTAVIFWTKANQKVNEIDFLEEPDEQIVGELIQSVASGNQLVGEFIEDDVFYSCTLSGAAARIAIRDWLEISLNEYRRSIAKWFEDIKIVSFNELKYSSLYALSRSAANENVKNDTTQSRAATFLWKAAIKGSAPPLWFLSAVLKRVRLPGNDEDKRDSFTKEHAALIKLVLNRNYNKQIGGFIMKEKLDNENKSPAYLSGRIFAVLEKIQQAALGSELNAGIRDRFFSFASTTPAPAFGRLMKLSQNHLTKLRGEKPGYAVNLDKELQELCALLPGFPASLTLEEQGQFALGYYHQKHESYAKAIEKKNQLNDNQEAENE